MLSVALGTPVRFRTPPGGEWDGYEVRKQCLGQRECAGRMGSLPLAGTQKRVTQTRQIDFRLLELPLRGLKTRDDPMGVLWDHEQWILESLDSHPRAQVLAFQRPGSA